MSERTSPLVVLSVMAAVAACAGPADPAPRVPPRATLATDEAGETIVVDGLPAVRSSALSPEEQRLAREAIRVMDELPAVPDELSLAEYAQLGQTTLERWIAARAELLERLAAPAPGVRASQAGALAGALALAASEQLLGIPLPREIRGDAELTHTFRAALRERASTSFAGPALPLLDVCARAYDEPWDGWPCSRIRRHILSTVGRALADSGTPNAGEFGAGVVPEGVYPDAESRPRLEFREWPSACDYPAGSRAPAIVPTATRFVVRTPIGIVAALGDHALEALRASVESRVAALTQWTATPSSVVLEADRAESAALASGDACGARNSAERELARGGTSLVIVSVQTRCFQPGTPCRLSLVLSQVDGQGAPVAARLPTFAEEAVQGIGPEDWRSAAGRLHAAAPMFLGVLRAPRLLGVMVDVASPNVDPQRLAHDFARLAPAAASCAFPTMDVSVELALAFSAEGRPSLCVAGARGQPTVLTRCACDALRATNIPPARDADRIASVTFSLGAAPRTLAAGLEVRIPERSEDGALSSPRARDEFARCLGVPTEPIAYEVTMGGTPQVRRRSGRQSGPAPDAECIVDALRALPACAPLPTRVTLCARPVAIRE